MATVRSFNSMLNDYIVYDLMAEELQKRSYLLENVEKENNWKGGPLPVPFKGASATSYKFGGLTATNDISEFAYVRGSVDDYKEIWGTMKWNARDLMEHEPVEGQPSGIVNEQSFLKILPDQLDEFLDGMKDCVSVALLCGSHFAKLTADATANDGNIVVDRPERFSINQKVIVDDDNTAAQTGYVKTVNINTSTINLVTTRGGVTVVDFSAAQMTTAQNAKVYVDGAQSNSFTSLRDQLLSAANGGSANLFGQSKLAYPYLQAINVSGALMSATNVLDIVFDGWTTINKLGKGHATDVLMSYKHLGSVMKLLEAGAGAYRHVSTKASVYGYTEIVVVGVKGQLKLVGVHEMDDDVMYVLDWKALKLHSNGWFRKQVDPEGKQYYTVREETGYYYICDICFFGELILHAPCRCGIIFGINY